MLNIITPETTKKQVLESYRDYQDVWEKGIASHHACRIEPILCEIPEKSKVLDIGCNTGEFMLLLKKKNCEVVGIDVSDDLIDKAKSKGLDVRKADAEELPFEDNSFDVVVMMEVLIHLHNPEKALKEVKRILRPNGFLLGSTPHKNIESFAWEETKFHHRYPDERELTQTLKAFDKKYIKALNGAQFNVAWANSPIGDKTAEMLFKCGGDEIFNWEHALKTDTKTLRVWMGPTQPPGGVYYRMIGYAEKMRKMEGTEIGFQEFQWDKNESPGEWETRIIRSEEGEQASSLALHQFEKLLQVANPWVFGICNYTDTGAILECAKDVYKDKKLITEVDDWLFDIPSYNVASHPYSPNSPSEQNAHDQLELSDAIICSTSFLKENLKEMFPRKKIYVISNSIDFDFWDKAKANEKVKEIVGKKKGIRIAYTGCGNHNGDLEIIKPVLVGLLEEYPDLEILTSQEFECFKDVKRIRNLEMWAPMPDYPGMLKGWDFDIGIAPLRDNNFNRAKSNLRWLEYSALSKPTVMSKVRPFKESVVHNHTGLLCQSQKEWYTCLKELIDSKEQRMRLGENARREVFKNFNMDDWAAKYRGVLEEIKCS